MKGLITAAGVVVTAAIFVAVMVVGWSVGHGPATANNASASAPLKVHEYLTVATPDQLNGTEDTGPAYVPANMTFPANADVTVTITNFDSADGLSGPHSTAQGIEGTVSYASIPNQDAPNVTAPVTNFDTSMISHTFTVAQLKLNVPVMAHGTTTFTFHTGAAGTYTWQCYVPCGTGDSGWLGPMSTKGYMTGTITVA